MFRRNWSKSKYHFCCSRLSSCKTYDATTDTLNSSNSALLSSPWQRSLFSLIFHKLFHISLPIQEGSFLLAMFICYCSICTILASQIFIFFMCILCVPLIFGNNKILLENCLEKLFLGMSLAKFDCYYQ